MLHITYFIMINFNCIRCTISNFILFY